MVTAPTCSDTRKGEKTLITKSKLKLRETSLTDVRNTYCWTWQEKSLNWSNKKHLLLNACFTVHFIRLESTRVKSDNVHTFSLVEKAPVMIKSKIPMCWTHGLPWELVETKIMADKHQGLQLAFHSFDQFYSGVVYNQEEG